MERAIARSEHSAAFQIAEGYAWCGDHDRAFEWLGRALEQRDPGPTMIKYSPLLRSLRGDPRYLALPRKLHLSTD